MEREPLRRGRVHFRRDRYLYFLFLDQNGAVGLGQFETRNLGLLHRAPLLVAATDHAMGRDDSDRGLLCAFYLRIRKFVWRSGRGERWFWFRESRRSRRRRLGCSQDAFGSAFCGL